MNFDEINPKFNLSKSDIKCINEIENLLGSIRIDKRLKASTRKKSQVRSVHSSLAIEANSLSLEEVNSIFNSKKILGPKKDIQEVKNAIEVYNNIDRFNWRKQKDLNKVHSLLMKYFDDDNGKYRNHGEGIKRGKKIIYMAPESILVESLMDSLFKYIKENEKTIHPLILSSIFHYYFVYIHPYTDGNGRTARFWVSLMLSDYNDVFSYLPIEETIYKYRKQYYKAIDSCHDNGNANVFIRFMLKIIKETIVNTTQKTTQKKITKNQEKILEIINKNPKITRNELAKSIGITSDGIKYNLDKLRKENIIQRIGPDKGGYWIVTDK